MCQTKGDVCIWTCCHHLFVTGHIVNLIIDLSNNTMERTRVWGVSFLNTSHLYSLVGLSRAQCAKHGQDLSWSHSNPYLGCGIVQKINDQTISHPNDSNILFNDYSISIWSGLLRNANRCFVDAVSHFENASDAGVNPGLKEITDGSCDEMNDTVFLITCCGGPFRSIPFLPIPQANGPRKPLEKSK